MRRRVAIKRAGYFSGVSPLLISGVICDKIGILMSSDLRTPLISIRRLAGSHRRSLKFLPQVKRSRDRVVVYRLRSGGELPSAAGTDECISLTKPLNPREWSTNSRNCYGCRFHKVDSRRCLSASSRTETKRAYARACSRACENRSEKGRTLKTLTDSLNTRVRLRSRGRNARRTLARRGDVSEVCRQITRADLNASLGSSEYRRWGESYERKRKIFTTATGRERLVSPGIIRQTDEILFLMVESRMEISNLPDPPPSQRGKKRNDAATSRTLTFIRSHCLSAQFFDDAPRPRFCKHCSITPNHTGYPEESILGRIRGEKNKTRRVCARARAHARGEERGVKRVLRSGTATVM